MRNFMRPSLTNEIIWAHMYKQSLQKTLLGNACQFNEWYDYHGLFVHESFVNSDAKTKKTQLVILCVRNLK